MTFDCSSFSNVRKTSCHSKLRISEVWTEHLKTPWTLEVLVWHDLFMSPLLRKMSGNQKVWWSWWIIQRLVDRQTDRQTDSQTDSQIDRQTDSQSDRQTDRLLLIFTVCKSSVSAVWRSCRAALTNWSACGTDMDLLKAMIYQWSINIDHFQQCGHHSHRHTCVCVCVCVCVYQVRPRLFCSNRKAFEAVETAGRPHEKRHWGESDLHCATLSTGSFKGQQQHDGDTSANGDRSS